MSRTRGNLRSDTNNSPHKQHLVESRLSETILSSAQFSPWRLCSDMRPMGSLLIKICQEASQRVINQKIDLNLPRPQSIKKHKLVVNIFTTADDNVAREGDQLRSRDCCHPVLLIGDWIECSH